MPIDDSVPVKNAPATWGAANRMLAKGNANVTDSDLFGDDPLAPSPKADPMKYLGHFANDGVASEGHNVGAKQIGVKEAGGGGIAKNGYRSIPGNVNVPYVAKKIREATETAHATSYRYGGPIPSSGYGPVLAKPDAAPLRKAARAAKAAAKSPKGPLRSKSR